jgi:hypothetical protein
VRGKDDVGLPDWLQVIRASCHIFQAVWPHIQNVPFMALVTGGVAREPLDTGPPEMSDDDERLRSLVDMMESSLAKHEQNNLPSMTSPIQSALLILTRSFAKARAAQSRNNYSLWSVVHTWPVQVPQ